MTPPFKRNPETHRANELDEAAIWEANDDDCSQRWTGWRFIAAWAAILTLCAAVWWAAYLIF